MECKIEGGKMFVGGVEFQRTAGEDVVSGMVGEASCFISAGIVYLNGDCVGSVPYDAFKAWRDGTNETL